MVIAKWPSTAALGGRDAGAHTCDGQTEDAERAVRNTYQHVQPDEHEAGASSSCDAVTHDMTEASLQCIAGARREKTY